MGFSLLKEAVAGSVLREHERTKPVDRHYQMLHDGVDWFCQNIAQKSKDIFLNHVVWNQSKQQVQDSSSHNKMEKKTNYYDPVMSSK